MAKEVGALIKLQIKGGAANPSPPVGPALGAKGVNIMEFCKQFNARTQGQGDLAIPVVITVFSDRSFTFVTKTPPTSVLLKKVLGMATNKKPGSGSKEPNKVKVGKVSPAQLEQVAKMKIQDMNCHDLQSAINMVAGTAKSMGLEIK